MSVYPSIVNKKRSEARIASAPGFPRIGHAHYFDLLMQLHADLKPKTYFEIGTEAGASLSMADCVSYAVDPEFKLRGDVTGTKPELHLFQGTSDDFFASDMVRRMKPRFDLAFLDGLHLFEFLLRDFMNCEKMMAPGGTITMHDCVPFNHLAAEREWDRKKTRSWTGDVWKVIPILRQYRPDLDITIHDVRPSGLVVISNLDPMNTVLDQNYAHIELDWMNVTLEEFGLDNLNKAMPMTAYSGRDLRDTAPPPRPVPATPKLPHGRRIAVKTCVRRPKKRHLWGDFHFATGLAEALERRGHGVRVDCRPEWDREPEFSEIDIVIRGAEPYAGQAGKPYLNWVIYPGGARDQVSIAMAEAAAAAHNFFASARAHQSYLDEGGDPATASVLMQGFDARLMYPDDSVARNGVVFVGNNKTARGSMRPIVQLAHDAGADLRILGGDWENAVVANRVQADYIANSALGQAYRGAVAVLCDHLENMRLGGFVSNRVYDALACATPVICDLVQDLPEEFERHVYRCASAAEVSDALTRIASEDDAARAERRQFATAMPAAHSFDARACQIDSVIADLFAARTQNRKPQGMTA